jgi:hypothetical protein
MRCRAVAGRYKWETLGDSGDGESIQKGGRGERRASTSKDPALPSPVYPARAESEEGKRLSGKEAMPTDAQAEADLA